MLTVSASISRVSKHPGQYVKLLQSYNEIKDIGQQLMGLVAENRGVPVASLYQNGDFGVGPDD